MSVTLIIRSIFFLMCAQQINAQVNNYLIHQPVWKISSTCSVSYPCVQQETYNYYTNGDTLFNTFVYKKIVKKALPLRRKKLFRFSVSMKAGSRKGKCFIILL